MVSMIVIQLIVIFVIYGDTIDRYNEYILENEDTIESIIENVFVDYYELRDTGEAAGSLQAPSPQKTDDPALDYIWQHILTNNSDFWFNIESENFNASHGDVPISARNVRLLQNREATELADCYELTGKRRARGEVYSFTEIYCGSNGHVAWATGGIDAAYQLPEAFADFERSEYLIGIIKSAGAFSIGILLIIPLTVFLILRPVERFAKLLGGFSGSADIVNLPADQVPTELAAFVVAVNGAFERVRESYERENALRAAMAHELRTPLTILSARIDLLERSDVRDRLREDVSAMTDLIDRLLRLAEMTAVNLDAEIIDLSELVDDVVNSQKEFVAQSGQRISLHLTSEPTPVRVNRDTFALALSNVIINSIRHGHDDDQPSEKPINVTVKGTGEVIVQDFGSGFPDTMLQIINAQQADEKKTYRKARLGVGIMIVEAAMRSMGATVTFENAPSGGAVTRMCFALYETP